MESFNIATGISHRCNALKYRILMSAIRMPSLYFTSRDIADDIGVPITNVSFIFNHWHKHGYRYITRLPKRLPNGGAYRYKLLKTGVKTAIMYKRRVSLGFDLNCKKIYPEKVEWYARINKLGSEMGVSEDSLPDFSEYLD